MGRALTRVIAETPGAVLTGALEARALHCWARMPGSWRACPQWGPALGRSVVAVGRRRRHSDFTVPRAPLPMCDRRQRAGSRHRHHRSIGVG